MKINKKILTVTIIFINSAFNSAVSQSADSAKFNMQEITVYGNKISSDRFESPSKIQIIDKEKIMNKNGESLSDILQLAGSVFVKTYGGSSSLNTISLNGLGAENTLIMLDGFKLNSTQNGQLDLSNVLKDNLERIEILNNGMSSLYGSEAIGGVVNIITKKNISKELNLILNGQVGSFNQRKFFFDIKKNLKIFNFSFNFLKEASSNDYEYFYNNGIQDILKQRVNSEYDISNYSANISSAFNEYSKINFYSSYTGIFRNLPGIEAGSEPSKSNQSDNNWNNILSYENYLTKNLLFKSQLNFQNNLSNYNNGVIINSFYKNIYLSNNSQFNCTSENYEFASGYEVSYAALKSNEVEDGIERIQTGTFLVSQFNTTNFLKIFPSVRYDYVSDINQNIFTGKFGLNIKPFKNYKLNLKASAGNNFASPTFNELYWKDIGNKNLKPESSANFDVGAILNFDFISENIFEITYTYIDAKDKIVWSPDRNGLWTPKNIGKSLSNIILFDLNLNKRFNEDLTANMDFNYSYTQAIKKSKDFPNDPTYEKQIFYIPPELAKCNLSLNYKNSGLNLFYSFIGKRYTDFENRNYLTAVDLLEGNIFQNFSIYKINVQLKIEVNNIFNADYQIISGYPMSLRNYKFTLSLEY